MCHRDTGDGGAPVQLVSETEDEGVFARRFDLVFGSEEKTMHMNPGGHVQVPRFERDSSELFFRRHLLGTR